MRRSVMLLLVAVLGAGCGSGSSGAVSGTSAAEARADASSTTTTTASTTETAGPAGEVTTWADVELTACVEDPSGVVGVEPPGWLPAELPEGFELVGAGSQRFAQVDTDAAFDASVTRLLAETDGSGVVHDLVTITSFEVPPPTPFHSSEVADSDTVDGVRGQPGSVVMLINRSAQPWAHASWQENGRWWTSTADHLDPSELAGLLDGLAFDGDLISDPAGRLEQVSTLPHGDPGATHQVQFGMVGAAPDFGAIRVTVSERPEGSVGPGYNLAVGDSVVERDDRVVRTTPAGVVAVTGGGAEIEVSRDPVDANEQVDLVALALSMHAIDPTGPDAMASPIGPEALAGPFCHPTP